MRRLRGDGGFVAGLVLVIAGVALAISAAAYVYHELYQRAMEECGAQDRVWTECLPAD